MFKTTTVTRMRLTLLAFIVVLSVRGVCAEDTGVHVMPRISFEVKVDQPAQKAGFLADGRFAADDGRHISIFDEHNGARLARFAPGMRSDDDVALFTANGRDAIVTPGVGGGIIFHDSVNGEVLWRAQSEPLRIRAPSFASVSPSSKLALFVTDESTFFVDLVARQRGQALDWPILLTTGNPDVKQCFWSADEKTVWIAADPVSGTGFCGAFDVATGKRRNVFTGKDNQPVESMDALDICEKANVAYIQTAAGAFFASLDNGRYIAEAPAEEDARFSADGARLIAPAGVYDVRTGARLFEFPNAASARLSPSRTLLALNRDTTIQIYDTRSGLLLRELQIDSKYAGRLSGRMFWHSAETELAVPLDSGMKFCLLHLQGNSLPAEAIIDFDQRDKVAAALAHEVSLERETLVQQLELKPERSLPVLKSIFTAPQQANYNPQSRRLALLCLEEIAQSAQQQLAGEIETLIADTAKAAGPQAALAQDALQRIRADQKTKSLREALATPHAEAKLSEPAKPAGASDF